MAIDWTKPCETTEDPPRPVRVLCTDRKNDTHPVVVELENGDITAVPISGKGFRNVAPKPVRREAWVNLYKGAPGNTYASKVDADLCQRAGRVECRRIVWNSDGSPVDDTVSKEEYDRVCSERDALKKIAVKSCDNCANGPFNSSECNKNMCAGGDGHARSWANWEPGR